MTINRRNSAAMIGRVRLKSNILPGSPANEGSAVRAFDNTAANRGFAAFGSSAFLLLRERKELFSLWLDLADITECTIVRLANKVSM
jgi:hypothetical protein